MAFLGTEHHIKSSVPLFEGIAPNASSNRLISEHDISGSEPKKSTRFMVGPYVTEEKNQPSFHDIASGRKSQYGLGGLEKDIQKLRDRIGISSKPHKMTSLLKVFRQKPNETGFVELGGVGEQLRVQFNLDKERNRRKQLQDLRARNNELKARIEERIVEYNERRRRSEEMKEGFEAVENRHKTERMIQTDRIKILNEMLGETKFVAQSEFDNRIKLQDLFRNDHAHQLEHKRLLSIMNSEAQKYNNEMLESQIELTDQIETAEEKERRQIEEDIKMSEEYLKKYKRKVSKVLKLKHLDGGPKSKMVERLQIMRKINPKAIENKIKLETEELSRRMKPNKKSTVSISKQKFAEILENQAKQKKKQLESEKDLIFRDKSLKEPTLGIQFATLPYFGTKETLHTKSSLPEGEWGGSVDSVLGSRTKDLTTLPAIKRRLSATPPTKVVQSDKVMHLSTSKRSLVQQLALEDRILDLLQDCIRLQVEDIEDNTTLRQLASLRPRLQNMEEDEVRLMKAILKNARSDESAARINHAFERHFKKQSKFGSFKIFKEHFVQVIGNVVKILEMEAN